MAQSRIRALGERAYRVRRIASTFGRIYMGIKAHQVLARHIEPDEMQRRWQRFNRRSAEAIFDTAVELRGAPWLGWIKDLSVPDPLYILPILMGVTSVAMQKMMPAPPDPMQRRMMQFLPIMFMFFAFAFPGGLVLYWVTNNLLSMVQQGVMMKLKKRREAAAG